jgi:hypothetical protein
MKLIIVQNNKRHDGRLKEYETKITLFQTLVIIQFSCQLLIRQSVIFELQRSLFWLQLFIFFNDSFEGCEGPRAELGRFVFAKAAKETFFFTLIE